MKASIIIKLQGNKTEDLYDALVEVVKAIVNHDGACGTGSNGKGTSFEFSTLYSDNRNRRGAFERSMKLSEDVLHFAKELIDNDQICTRFEEDANKANDAKQQNRINAASTGNQFDGLPDEAIAEIAAAAITAVLSRSAKAETEAKASQKPEGDTLH